jgi:hypothetical protein
MQEELVSRPDLINPCDWETAQETQALSPLNIHPFQTYLEQQQLSWSAIAHEADVLCLLVWNIAHGVSVRGRQAARVRVAVHRLSGVAYTGPMNTHEEELLQKPPHVDARTPSGEVSQ